MDPYITITQFLGVVEGNLNHIQMFVEAFFHIKLQPVLWVHHTQSIHDVMSMEFALQFLNKAFNNYYNPTSNLLIQFNWKESGKKQNSSSKIRNGLRFKV
jgi:hypothetical protein